MNNLEKKKLWHKLSRVLATAPKQFKPKNWLESECPRAVKAISKKWGACGIENITRYLAPELVVKCGTCVGPTKWSGTLKAFAPYCSLKCSNSSPDVQARKNAACVKSMGVEHPAQSAEVQRKMQTTTRARLGVDNASQAQSVKDKKAQTNLEKSGGLYTTPFQNPDAMRKAKVTMRKRYGAESTMQSAELKAKAQQTMIDRWGAPNPSQVSELFKKARESMREFYKVRAENFTWQLQGYEDMAVHSLLKIGVPARCIEESRKGIAYRHAKKDRVYHPDFEIVHKGQRVQVEVKSGYTSGLLAEGKLFPEVMAKARAVVKSGKPILLLVMRELKRTEVGYDRQAKKGERRGRVTHFMFSTPKRPDWELYSSRASKKELQARLTAWLNT